MKVVVLGLGYVGCTAAACIAKQGHNVVGVDVNGIKVDAINAGRSPIAETGLSDLIQTARMEGRLEARPMIGDALDDADLAIVCVGTPSGTGGGHDMRYIVSVTEGIARAIQPGRSRPLTVAYRSTMRPGTMDSLIAPILRQIVGPSANAFVELVYNPEFLREASAIEDYFAPPKIVVGTADGNPSATMTQLHEGIDAPVFHVPFRTAEITKFVDNSWHALKVAFANEIGRIAAREAIDPQSVHAIFKADTKLNLSAYYTRPGGPFGGSCLPKDVRALQYIAEEAGVNLPVVDAIIRSNQAHKRHIVDAALALLPPNGRVLIAGMAFKAGTDDLRESPNVDLARHLMDAGHDVRIFDPGIDPANLIGQNLGYACVYMPRLDGLLLDLAEAERAPFDLIIRTNRTCDALMRTDVRVLDVDRL